MDKPRGHVERWRRSLALIDELQEILKEDFLFAETILEEGAQEADAIIKTLKKLHSDEEEDIWICKVAGCFLAARGKIEEQLRKAELKFQRSNRP